MTNTNDDERTNALGLFNFARAYWLSGAHLLSARHDFPHHQAPITFLFYHAIELYLKAYLRSQGTTIQQLRKIGHRSAELLAVASSKGLVTSREIDEVISSISEDDAVIRSRYIVTGFASRPAEEALSEACSALDKAVSSALVQAGEPIRPISKAKKKSQDTGLAAETKKYIPHMTEHDRDIIGYLLARNQKMFTAAADGGYAATLLARGIVEIRVAPGQIVNSEDVPMQITDEAWEVLKKYRDQFPEPDDDTHPWRVPWWVR